MRAIAGLGTPLHVVGVVVIATERVYGWQSQQNSKVTRKVGQDSVKFYNIRKPKTVVFFPTFLQF